MLDADYDGLADDVRSIAQHLNVRDYNNFQDDDGCPDSIDLYEHRMMLMDDGIDDDNRFLSICRLKLTTNSKMKTAVQIM